MVECCMLMFQAEYNTRDTFRMLYPIHDILTNNSLHFFTYHNTFYVSDLDLFPRSCEQMDMRACTSHVHHMPTVVLSASEGLFVHHSTLHGHHSTFHAHHSTSHVHLTKWQRTIPHNLYTMWDTVKM